MLEKPSFLQKIVLSYKAETISNVKPKRKSQRSLRAWTKQKWRTKSGKKSSETGERYLPEKAIKALSASEYARTSRKEERRY